jgi:hypothetical protein
MGRSLTPGEFRARFVKPLSELANSFKKLCDDWERAHSSGSLRRADLLLNNATSEAGIVALRKLYRETTSKLEDAVAGSYRYRDAERRIDKHRGKHDNPAVPHNRNKS